MEEDSPWADDWNETTAEQYRLQKERWDAQSEETRNLINDAFEMGVTLGRLQAPVSGPEKPSDEELASQLLPAQLEGHFWNTLRKMLASELFRMRMRTRMEMNGWFLRGKK